MSTSSKETTMFPSKIESHGYVFENRFKKIEKLTATFDGFEKEYFVLDVGPKAGVLIVRDGEVLFVRQYRVLLNDLSYEIPGGLLKENESAETAAIRECQEETGITCTDLKPLVNFNPDHDDERNYTQIFYSEKVDAVSEEGLADYAWVPVEKALDMLFSETISDCLTVIALLAYQVKYGRKSI